MLDSRPADAGARGSRHSPPAACIPPIQRRSQQLTPVPPPFCTPPYRLACLPRDRESSALGWLSSAAVHLVLFITLALLLSPMDLSDRAEISIELLAVEPIEPMDEFSFTSPFDEIQPTSTDSSLPEVELTLTDPMQRNVAWQPGSTTGARNHGHTSSGRSGLRGEFFGTVAYGERFVYVLDMSSSMSRLCKGRYGGTRFEVATEELIRSVDQLSEDQQFYVILFCSHTRQLFDSNSPVPQMLPATAQNKQRLRQWLRLVKTNGGTDPRAAVRTGLQMKPSALFLLSDGEFNGQQSATGAFGVSPDTLSIEEVVAANRHDYTPLHTIAFEDRTNCARMRALAESTGGTYLFVSDDNREPSPEEREQRARQLKRAADALYRRGRIAAAAGRYRDLVKDYPSTDAADEARTILTAMSKNK
jgi:hypothetical protein